MSYHQAATRVRAGSKLNRSNTPVVDWDNPLRLDLGLVSIQPVQTSEAVNQTRDVAQIDAYLFTNARGTLPVPDITATDRIEAGELTYEVVGVRYWPHPRKAQTHHLEISLKAWGT